MKAIALVSGLLLATSAWATTGYWTGAVDGDWAKPGNWQGGTVPGVLASSGAKGDIAVFDGANLSGAKATTIDLANLASIKTIKVEGGATTPVFTFGTDKNQLIPLEYQGSFYVGSVAAGDETPVPTLTAILCLSLDATETTWGGSDTPDKGVRAYVYNYNPDQVLHLNDFGRATKASKLSSINSEGLVLRGFDFQLDGVYLDSPLFEIFAYCRKLTVGPFDPNGKLRDIIVNETAKCTIEVPEGQILNLPGSTQATAGYYSLYALKPVEIVGAGVVQFSCSYYASYGLWPGPMILGEQRGDVTIRTRFFSKALKTAYAPSSNEPGWLVFGNYAAPSATVTNRLVLAGDNCVSGTVAVTEREGAVVVDSIGLIGHQSPLGYGSCVRLSNGSALEYTGAGETADRTLMLTNYGVSATGVLRHNGTGPLVYQGMVSQQVETATLVLDGASAVPGRFESVIAERPQNAFANPSLSFEKRGIGTWILSAANTYTGSTVIRQGTLVLEGDGALTGTSGIELGGGVLELAASDEAATLSVTAPVTLSAATSTIVIGKNRTLVLSALPTRTGSQRLNVSIPGFWGTFKVSGVSAGPAPDWLTVNGCAAHFGAEGVLYGRETLWKTAASGEWTTVANWSDGVPDAGKDAVIHAAGEDYEVSVVTEATARNLFVEGADATLKVTGAFFADGTNAVASSLTDAQAVATDAVAVRDGACVDVDGGDVTFTNFQGRIAVESSVPAVTSVFRVVDGSLVYGGALARGRFEIGVGGRLEISNSTVTACDKLNQGGGIVAAGGEIDVSGTATFFHTPRKNGYEFTAFGTGTTTFRDDSRYIASIDNQVGALAVRPDRAGETAELRFEDTSRIDGYAAYYALGGTKGGRSIFTYDAANTNNYLKWNSSDQNIGYYLGVGHNYGYGEYNHLRGKTCIGSLGMMVGTCYGATNAELSDCAATGAVLVAGGEFRVSGFAALSRGWDATSFCPIGVTVGQGTLSKNKTGRPFVGSLTVAGGTFALTYGHLLVGTGAGEGDVTVTGGQLRIVDSPTSKYTGDVSGTTFVRYASNSVAVVGLAGGVGRFSLAGGNVNCWTDFYVGGANTNVFIKGPDGEKNIFKNYPFDAHDAKGMFTLSGGTFDIRNGSTFFIGADGTGELNVVGSAGSFNVGGMVLSNSTSSVVRFLPDAAGVSTLNVEKTLKIVAGSKLVLDLRNVNQTRSRSYKLFDCGAIEGTFSDFTLENAEQGVTADVDVRGSEVWCRVHSGRGSLLIVR